LNGDKTPWVKVTDTADDVTDLAAQGDALFLLSHKGASRFKVLKTSLSKPDLATA
jgi:prolyl oligopeptidase